MNRIIDYTYMRLRFISIVLSLLFAAPIASQDSWSWQYPKPQGNSLRDIFVLDSNKTIAVGDLGTIIRTSDSGENWESCHSTGGSLDRIERVYFIDDRMGWIINKNAVLLTIDGGETFNGFYKNDTCDLSLVYFVNKDTGFVFGITKENHKGICFKTTTGGNSWITRQMESIDLFGFTSICFTNGGIGWATADGFWGNELYKSVDQGDNWTQQNLQPRVFGLKQVQFIDNKTGFLCGSAGAFLKTLDGGATWSYYNISDKYNREEYQYFYSMSFTDSLNGWIVGGDYNGFILRTIDGGFNWEESDLKIPHHLFRISFFNTLYGWIVGQFGLIYRTIDGGDSWVSQKKGRTVDFRGLSSLDGHSGWAVGSEGSILHTIDGGNSWHESSIHENRSFSAVHMIDDKNIIIAGAVTEGVPPAPIFSRTGVAHITHDGGQTWIIQTFDSSLGFNSISFPSADVGWLVGNGFVYKTMNSGKTWKVHHAIQNGYWTNVQFVDESTGWLLGSLDTTIYCTVDSGKTWSNYLIHEGAAITSMFFINKKTGWVVGDYRDGNNLFKTDDGGQTWLHQETSETCHLNAVYFTDEQTGWCVGYNYLESRSCIFHTLDGGEHWQSQASPAFGRLFSLIFIGDEIGWVVGEGAILKTTNGGESSTEKYSHKQYSTRSFQLYQNYPNPFNSYTLFQFHIYRDSHVTIKIFNVNGREIGTLWNRHMSIGEYNIKWAPNDIPSGIYFCILQSEVLKQTIKLVLIK